jgi:hypothetical protein
MPHVSNRKITKRQTIVYKTQNRKLKIEEYEPTKKNGANSRCSKRVDNSSSTSGARCGTIKPHEHHYDMGIVVDANKAVIIHK